MFQIHVSVHIVRLRRLCKAFSYFHWGFLACT
jgi:hypothetical protein